MIRKNNKSPLLLDRVRNISGRKLIFHLIGFLQGDNVVNSRRCLLRKWQY